MDLRPAPALAVSLALASLCACTSFQQRTLLARGKLVAVAPVISTQLLTEVPITAEEGRLVGSADFDIALSSVTCLRGSLNHHDLSICAEALPPGARATVDRRWRSMSSTANLGTANYGVELDATGQKLRWESGLAFATILLGADPLAEAVRAQPELIGALIACGQVPPAKDGLYRLVPDAGFDKPEPGRVRAELLAAYKDYSAAVAARDYAGVMALLAPDVVWSHPNGDTELRPQVETSMRAFLGSLQAGANMVTRLRHLDVTGPITAVAEVEVETRGQMRSDGGALVDVHYTTWWRDTWTKGPAGWRNQIGLEFDQDPLAEPAAQAPATAPRP